MDENILIGRIIHNHYLIETELGSGAYGSVYKAKHTKLGDYGVVAIKIWHAKNSLPEQRDSFRREAEMLARLKHRHILRFFDYSTGADENFPYPYLITEYASKGSLQDLIRSHSHNLLPLEKVYTILSQIGQALHHAHKENIIHRDLKPANILFNDQDEALLADFGIAAIASAPVMSTGKIYGTLHYMAPEQFTGKFSERSDLYATGVITYQLVTGCMPLTASGFIQWLRKHESSELPIDPREHNPQLPAHMAQTILKALAKDPADRYDDIEAYLRALGVPLHQETIFITTQTGMHQEEAERWLSEGKVLLQDLRPKEALTAFDKALNLDPKSAEAYLQRGEVLVALGESWEAFTAFEMAASYNPKLTDAYIRIGDIFSSNGNYQEALKEYSKAQQVKPDSPYIWLKIANTLIKLDRGEEALGAYDKAINYTSAFNDSINLRYEKINLLFRLRLPDHVIKSEVIKEYDRIIQLSSDPIDACYKKIKFLINYGWYPEAFATYDQLIQLKPNDIGILYQKAALQEKLGYVKEALVSYDQIIELVPGAIDAQYKMLDLLLKLNQPNDALKICDRIIQLAPNDIDGHRKMLDLLLKLNQPNDALKTCDRIIQLMPDTIDIRRIKLDLLESLKYNNQVIGICNEIISLDPDCADIYYRKGKAYEMLDRPIVRKKDVNILIARLTRIPSHSKHALTAYEKAEQISTDEHYRESIQNLLRRLGKSNQAKAYSKVGGSHSTWIDRYRIVSGLFFLLPWIINSLFIALIFLISQQPPELMIGMVIAAFCISIIGPYVIYRKDEPHHLYNSSLLFLPSACFAIEWLFVGLVSHFPIAPTIFIALLGFIGNALLYLFIDISEEQAPVIIRDDILYLLGRIGWLLDIVLKGIWEVSKFFMKAWKAYSVDLQERKRILKARKATVSKTAIVQKKPYSARRSIRSSPPKVITSFKKDPPRKNRYIRPAKKNANPRGKRNNPKR